MIGLIGAMALEMERLTAQVEEPVTTEIGMDRFVSGRLFGQEAVLAVCGPGKVNAAVCTAEMIMSFQPERILNLGVAGAGEPGVTVGDIVIASAAVQHDMDTTAVGDPAGYVSKVGVIEFKADPVLCRQLISAAGSIGRPYHVGTIATGDRFIASFDDRESIRRLFSPKAVEMEGAAVAHVCHMHGTPWGIIRSISDCADGSASMAYPQFVEMAAEQSCRLVQALLSGC